jgi:hypothetical protein
MLYNITMTWTISVIITEEREWCFPIQEAPHANKRKGAAYMGKLKGHNKINKQQLIHNRTKNLQGSQMTQWWWGFKWKKKKLKKDEKRATIFSSLVPGSMHISKPQLAKRVKSPLLSKKCRARPHDCYMGWFGDRPMSLHCSGSKEDITCPLSWKSSPSIPQPLCVCFPAFIFTDFTCRSLN